jgi:hypothetical protein
MAKDEVIKTGLGGFGNINPYGMSQELLSDYQDTIEKNITALENRYKDPNWFKVSAGFLKPQLGGFGASLGSAAEAMGENTELQRSSLLPVARMRSELAQTGLLISNKKKAAEIAEKAQRENRNLTPQEQEEISNLDSERGQRLIQSQDVRAKTVQNNREMTINNAKARGLPVPVMNEMGLPETGKFPTGGGTQGGANPARVTPAGGANVSGSSATGTTTGATGTTTGGAPAPVEVAVNTGTENKPVERIELKTPGSEVSVLNPSELVKTGNERLYVQLDEQGADHIKKLRALGGDVEHAKTIQPIKDVLNYSNDPRFNEVMGILSGRGFLSGLAELIQNGVHASAAQFNAAVSLDLQKVALAIKKPETKAFAQNLYRALAQIELNNQKSIGLNPSSARNAEFGLLANASAHPDTLPSAARLFAKQSELNQLRNRDLYSDIKELISNKHKRYVVDPNSPTKMYLYMSSPSQQKIIEQYDKALDAEVQKYLEATGGGKK